MTQTILNTKIAYGRFVATVDFNAGNTDTSLAILIPAGCTTYKVEGIHITNASQTLTTATVGLFSAAGGTGTTFVANTAVTVASGTVGAANSSQTIAGVSTVNGTANPIFIRIGTAQGAPATADVVVTIKYLN